jgi:hypothetical protein
MIVDKPYLWIAANPTNLRSVVDNPFTTVVNQPSVVANRLSVVNNRLLFVDNQVSHYVDNRANQCADDQAKLLVANHLVYEVE